MQTKILISLMALFMSVAASAQQPVHTATINNNRLPEKQSSFTFSVMADENAPSFGLYIYNPEKKKIELQISHPVNGAVVDTSFTNEQFNRRYNFEQADDGRYLITLISGKEKISKTVEINTITKRNVVIR